MKVIGVCGKLGSGKDAFADYLVRKHDFKKISMSDIIMLEMESVGIKDIDRFKLQEFSENYKEKYGNNIWANACLEYARRERLRKVVISGMRDIAEVEFFKNVANVTFTLVCVSAEKETRFERIRKRKSIKDVETFADFIRQESKEAKIFNLYENCEDYAEHIVKNNNTLIELYAAAEELLKKIN